MNIGILIWPDAEVLDFCGPFEIFNNLSKTIDNSVNVFIVSKTIEPVNCQGMTVIPSYDFTSCPKIDVLVVPGGNSEWIVEQHGYLNWISNVESDLQFILTVCTGALVTAKLGLIKENMEATTHQVGMLRLKKLAPHAKILNKARFTDNGKIIMSGGISAGIDSSLYLISKIWNMETANKIAVYTEYDWIIKQPNIDVKIFD